MRWPVIVLFVGVTFVGCLYPRYNPTLIQPAAAAEDDDAAIDWERARTLLRRERAGETLTAEEQAYLERAKRARAQQAAGGQERPVGGKSTVGFKPLTEMTAEDRYLEQVGGLYGAGLNEPPASQLAMAMVAAQQVQPRAADGTLAADGVIGLLSVGMSNTTQEFSAFVRMANADPLKSARVMLIDGAQGGRVASHWADPNGGALDAPNDQQQGRPSVWDVVDQRMQRMQRMQVTPAQVQVAWIKQAEARPSSIGAFPAHAEALAGWYAGILVQLHERFPNLKLAYFSSRTYAGWATTQLNPEPYAYESGFAVRWTIQKQMLGDPALNADPAKGDVTAPVALWGPYLWTDGESPRASDGLVWLREDVRDDGTHPSESGQRKVAEQLSRFFQTDPTAKGWYLADGPAAPAE